jgi:AraC family transcriptional regulator
MAMRRATREDYQSRISKVQAYIEAHLSESLVPADLAKRAGFSLHHFHRIFRAEQGESVLAHVRRLRLEHAARLLRTTERRILDLALEAGYESHEAFTRAFADRFAMSPSEFRESPLARATAWTRAHTVPLDAGRVTVRRCAQLRLATMRHRGSYDNVSQVWQRMLGWARAKGLLLPGAELYGLCPDDPEVTVTDHLRFDAAIAIDKSFVPDASVQVALVEQGTYACATHKGPYHTLHETYLDVIGRWFPQSGYALAADAVVEHYLNDPTKVPSSEILTEIRVRIADE